MLINLSNHPSELWESNQFNDALQNYSSVYDIPFPHIPPDANENFIRDLAAQYADECMNILKKYHNENNAVHIMGEFNFSFAVINLLLSKGIKCVASTTQRSTIDLPDGSKKVNFNFVKFREYKI